MFKQIKGEGFTPDADIKPDCIIEFSGIVAEGEFIAVIVQMLVAHKMVDTNNATFEQ